MPKEHKNTSKSQKDKFIETARELGCDESEKAFNEKLKRLAKPEKSKKEKSNAK